MNKPCCLGIVNKALNTSNWTAFFYLCGSGLLYI